MRGINRASLRTLACAGALLACATPALASNVNIWHRVHATVPIRDLAYGASGYAAAGANGIWTSTDLTNWTQVTVPAGMGLPYDTVIWTGSEYLAGGAGGIVSSPDGGTWTQVYGAASTGLNINSIVYAGGVYLAVGSDDNGAVVLRSTDGTSWTPESTGLVDSGGTTYVAYGVNYGNGLYVVQAESVNYETVTLLDHIVTSPDGITWTEATLPNGGADELLGDSYDGAYGNGTFVEGGFSGVYTSTDGVNWTAEFFPAQVFWLMVRIGFENGHFVGTGFDFDVTPEQEAVFVSSDGSTWQKTDLANRRSGSTYDLGTALWNGSDYVAAGYLGAWSSPEGTSWTQVYDGPQSNGFNCLGYGGGNYLMLPDLDLGLDSLILRSTDGTSWPDTLTDAGGVIGGGAGPGCVAYGDGRFVAGGFYGSANLFYSSDGVTWNAGSTPANFTFGPVTWNGSKFVDFGGDANLAPAVFTSPDGVNWSQAAFTGLPGYGINQFQLSSTHGGFFSWPPFGAPLYVSPNGTNWAAVTLPPDMSHVVDVVYGRGRYVVAGGDANDNLVIAESRNGLTWTEETGLPGDLSVDYSHQIVYGGGEFLIPVFDRATELSAYLTSHDGLTWTETAQPGNWNLQSVVWDGTKFVASSFYDIFNAPGVRLDLGGKVKPILGGGVHLRYTFRLRNDSPDGTTANDAVFSDPLPASVALQGAASSRGSCSASGRTVSCQLGDLDAGAAAIVVVQVRVTRPVCRVTNTAEGYAEEPVRDDASPRATVTIRRPGC